MRHMRPADLRQPAAATASVAPLPSFWHPGPAALPNMAAVALTAAVMTSWYNISLASTDIHLSFVPPGMATAGRNKSRKSWEVNSYPRVFRRSDPENSHQLIMSHRTRPGSLRKNRQQTVGFETSHMWSFYIHPILFFVNPPFTNCYYNVMPPALYNLP